MLMFSIENADRYNVNAKYKTRQTNERTDFNGISDTGNT